MTEVLRRRRPRTPAYAEAFRWQVRAEDTISPRLALYFMRRAVACLDREIEARRRA